jgi:hypothetical protein
VSAQDGLPFYHTPPCRSFAPGLLDVARNLLLQ